MIHNILSYLIFVCRSTTPFLHLKKRYIRLPDTYTIMKECISEQDHYHTFPNKGYSIDEECDLVEVHGDEVLLFKTDHL